jgi:hypothetical protein
MKEAESNDIERKINSHECPACGAAFESFERLRQHAVDCRDDEGAELL